MLKAIGIYKNFGSVEILKGIDLHIKEQEIVSIVGPSGAGKTTLLQVLGTLLKPDAGQVFLNDVELSSLNSKQLAKYRGENIGFVFQFHQLLPEFTALENVMLPALIAKEKESTCKKRAMDLLERLGVENQMKQKPNTLSGGEKQRVAVARALINNPSIIFADEPSGSLDTQNAVTLHQLFKELQESFKQSFVVVTHNPELAKIADRTLQLIDGKIEMNLEYDEI